MRRPLNKAGDDPPQGQQRLIDATGLARPTAAYTTPRNVLATGQVDQIKLAHTHHLLTLDAWLLNGINDGVIKLTAGIKKIYIRYIFYWYVRERLMNFLIKATTEERLLMK